MADETLSVLVQLVDEISAPLDSISGKLDGFVSKIGDLAGGLLSLDGAFKVFENAADAADKLQDTARALDTFSSSAKAGAEALNFFKQAQDETRSTAIQLADMYTRILPLGIRQGWSEAGLQEITVELDQLATAAGRAPEEMQAAFTRLLASGGGHGAGRNALLQVLGITAEDLKDAGDNAGQVLAEAIQNKIASMGGSIPDSLTSAWAKAKDDLSTALGEGFMAAFGQGSDGMRALRDMFKDPLLLDAIKTIGQAFGTALENGVPFVIKALGGLLGGINYATDSLGQAIGSGGAAGSLSPGNAASQDAYIALLRQSRGAVTSPYGLYGAMLGLGPYEPWQGTGLVTGPGYDSPPVDTAPGGGSPYGNLGGNVKQATDDLTKYNAALEQLAADWKADKAAGVDLSSFIQLHISDLAKLYDQTIALNQADSVTLEQWQQMADAKWQSIQNLNSIPVAGGGSLTSASGLLNAMSQPTTFLGLRYNTDTGQWEQDPSFVATEDALLQANANQQEEMNVKINQENERAELQSLTRIAEAWKQEFANVFSDLFADLATTGGANIGKILEQQLGNTAKQFGQQLAEAIGNALAKSLPGGGIKAGDINPNTGVAYTQAQADQANAIQAGQYGQAVFAVAGFGYQLAQGGESPLQGAISGASAGASVGQAIGGTVGGLGAGAFGGLIGVFVGALIAALTEAMPSIQTYAVPVIVNGVAKLTDMVGEIAGDPSQQQAWLAKIQDSFDQFRNGYANILLSLPDSIRSQVLPSLIGVLTRLSNGPLSTLDNQGGGSSPFPSPYSNPNDTSAGFLTAQDWQSAMNNWLQSTLPSSTMQAFHGPFEEAFLAMGGTIDKFNEIWTKAEGMSGQNALQYLNDYYSTVGTLQDLITKLSQPINVGGGSGLYATTLATSTQSFSEQLKTADEGIVTLGNSLQYLTGQSQIQGAQQLNTLIQNRYALEQQMVQQIVSLIQTATTQLAANEQVIALRGKTPAEQYAYYQQQLPGLERQLGQATNPQQATSIYNQIVNDIMASSGLYPNRPDIQTWAQNTLSQVFGAYNTVLQRFGQQIDQVNQQLTSQLQPVLTLFTTSLNQFGVDLTSSSTSVSALDAASASAASSILTMADAADYFVQKMAAAGYVAQTRRARAA